MAAAYLPLVLVAALAFAIGWQVASARATKGSQTSETEAGLPRLLQRTIALVALLAMAAILLPWTAAISRSGCPSELAEAGECVAGLALTPALGVLGFAIVIGVSIAYVMRRGLFDSLPVAAPNPEPDDEAHAPTPAPTKREPGPAGPAAPETASGPRPATRPAAAPSPGPVTPTSAAMPPEPPPPPPTSGLVTTPTIDGREATLADAIAAIARDLGRGRIGVVFSGDSDEASNAALDRLATAIDARRFIVADSDDEHGEAARRAAGPLAGHESELALELAAKALDMVLLLDIRADFAQIVLAGLRQMRSACLVTEHGDISRVCDVVVSAREAPGAAALLEQLLERVAADPPGDGES